MNDSKCCIFLFESASLDAELALLPVLADQLSPDGSPSNRIRLDIARDFRRATELIDAHHAHYFGRPYDAAVVNLSGLQDTKVLDFLLNPHVLGLPSTIFVASMQGLKGCVDGYRRAINHVELDQAQWHSGKIRRLPSCVECYTAQTREPCALTIGGHVERILLAQQNGQASRGPRHADHYTQLLLRTPINEYQSTLYQRGDAPESGRVPSLRETDRIEEPPARKLG